jgi:hypothetical protein
MIEVIKWGLSKIKLSVQFITDVIYKVGVQNQSAQLQYICINIRITIKYQFIELLVSDLNINF